MADRSWHWYLFGDDLVRIKKLVYFNERFTQNRTSTTADPAATKKCRSCASPIPEDASLCSVCKSYQDWRRFTGASTTFFAIITAFVSVLTVSLPQLTTFFEGTYSSIDIRLSGIIQDRAVFAITNSGNRPTTLNVPDFGFFTYNGQGFRGWKAEIDQSPDRIAQLFIDASKSKQLVLYLNKQNGLRNTLSHDRHENRTS